MRKPVPFLTVPLLAAAALILGPRAEAQRGVRAELAGPDGQPVGGKTWMLVIGINAYARWPKLKGAVPDAQAVADVLRTDYKIDREIVLYDSQATYEGIETAFPTLARDAQVEDSVLVYYAGHGQFDESMNSGYWVPCDAEPNTTKGLLANLVIVQWLKKLRCRHVLLVSDSCFSGDFLSREGPPRETEPLDDYHRRVWKLRSRKALTSGSHEPVADVKLQGHSPFAYFLLDALQNNQAPYLSSREVFDRLAVGVAHNSDQVPRHDYIKDAGDNGGEFLFFRKNARTTATVTVRSTPAGAKVYVADAYKGTTPCAVTVDLAGGEQSVAIRVEKDGYQSNRSRLPLRPGQDLPWEVELERLIAPPVGPRPGETRINPVDGAELVWIPGGSFQMGSDAKEIDALWAKTGWDANWKQFMILESPKHRVSVEGFWAYKQEVTNEQ